MATTIAISGKGGSGKTTLSAMIIRLLIERSMGSVLAVDADPNSCLGLTMGAEVADTIAGIREQARKKTPDGTGMDKTRLLEYGVQQAIVEAKGFDLLTMGHPEGPSCYCAANNLLRSFMDKLSDAYRFVVLDNEAGMEHLSRRTTNNVDLLFIIAEPGRIGQITAERIFELTRQLPIMVKRTGIIWNKSDGIHEMAGVESFGFVPYDKAIADCSMQSKTVFDIEIDSPAFLALREIIEQELKIRQN
ncbi:MAG: AAA family ATPase [Planctomycetes bacterium]|nr:AAA family ATPase [Planctomycetota bacterium]